MYKAVLHVYPLYGSKKICYGCLSIPRDNNLASLCRLSDAEWLPLEWIFQSTPHAHDRFLYSGYSLSRTAVFYSRTSISGKMMAYLS